MQIDFAKLLGFNTVTDEFSKKDLDFQNDTFSDKLGAKIGPPEDVSPPKGIDFQDETFGARLGAKVSSEVN